MSNWNGYLSEGTRATIVDVMIEAGLSNRAGTVSMLNGLSNYFIAQLPASQGLPDSVRLGNELNHINKISKLTSGKIPIEIFLSNLRRYVQDIQHIDSINEALLEIKENPPSSHTRFDTNTNPASKRKLDSTDGVELHSASDFEYSQGNPSAIVHDWYSKMPPVRWEIQAIQDTVALLNDVSASENLMTFAEDVGLQRAKINTDPKLLVRSILTCAADDGKYQKLIQKVYTTDGLSGYRERIENIYGVSWLTETD